LETLRASGSADRDLIIDAHRTRRARRRAVHLDRARLAQLLRDGAPHNQTARAQELIETHGIKKVLSAEY
jgi:hypothetical protein